MNAYNAPKKSFKAANKNGRASILLQISLGGLKILNDLGKKIKKCLKKTQILKGKICFKINRGK